MNLDLGISVPALTVFVQGLLSFLSPCVLPLIPIYTGDRSGGAKTVEPDGSIRYRRGRVMGNTLCFVAGVSFAFFVLGMGFTVLGRFFTGHQALFARLGGILVILFGLYQLGVFGQFLALGRERRLPLRLDRLAMNPLTALVLGFTFSFAWTPCVGPVLAAVLLMAASSASSLQGFVLIGVYTLGFVLPFLAVGLFTGTLLNFFKRHQAVVKYTVKAGGVLMILMGVMMLTGWMNRFTGYLNTLTGGVSVTEPAPSPSAPEPTAGQDQVPEVPAPDFTLLDQYGAEHSLSDYEGKVLFLNFWTTWCGYCVQEMPHIQELYEEYGENQEDVVILGVASPAGTDNPYPSDSADQEEICAFLEENGFTFPTLMDTDGSFLRAYGVGGSFPITFLVAADGNVYGYFPGAMSKDMMVNFIEQTLALGGS